MRVNSNCYILYTKFICKCNIYYGTEVIMIKKRVSDTDSESQKERIAKRNIVSTADNKV